MMIRRRPTRWPAPTTKKPRFPEPGFFGAPRGRIAAGKHRPAVLSSGHSPLPDSGVPMPDAFDSFPFLVLRRACVRAGTFLALLTGAVPLAAQTQWVATWATAPEPLVSSQSGFNPPSLGLANNSVRQ